MRQLMDNKRHEYGLRDMDLEEYRQTLVHETEFPEVLAIAVTVLCFSVLQSLAVLIGVRQRAVPCTARSGLLA